MWITSYLKRKIVSTHKILNFNKDYTKFDNKNKSDSATQTEKYSCWSILFIDEVILEAKIIHKGRGKFKIVEDKYNSKYINNIIDASDVIRCKVNPSDVQYYMKYKFAQFSKQNSEFPSRTISNYTLKIENSK